MRSLSYGGSPAEHPAGLRAKSKSIGAVILMLTLVATLSQAWARGDDDANANANPNANSNDDPDPAMPLTAPDDSMVVDVLESISTRLDQLEQENRSLRDALSNREGGATLPQTLDSNAFFQAIHDRVSGLELRAAEQLPLIKLGGFFQLDNEFVTQDHNSQNTYGDIQDGTGFRRARLQAYGALTKRTNYIIEMDFGFAGRPSFMDVWGEQTDLGWLGTVRIGQFRQPITMDS